MDSGGCCSRAAGGPRSKRGGRNPCPQLAPGRHRLNRFADTAATRGGRCAWQPRPAVFSYGPWILACDAARNPGLGPPSTIGLITEKFTKESRRVGVRGQSALRRNPQAQPAVFVPSPRQEQLVDATKYGCQGQVWSCRPTSRCSPRSGIALATRKPAGSICDGDPTSFAVTFDGTLKAEDCFAVKLDEPVNHPARGVYGMGIISTTAAGLMPQQASAHRDSTRQRRSVGSLGTLADYPNTTATDNRGLKGRPEVHATTGRAGESRRPARHRQAGLRG